METLDSESSPNKRLKTETLTLDSPVTPSSIKGKAPITTSDSSDDEAPAELPPQNCGICFSEEGKTVRGQIDSCDHYFCFICIIEWSKIDSRCPLCRGRFSSIRRVRKDGSFIGNGSVPVPIRDQIYDRFGDPVDPYSQAKCSVCKGTKDESLLLLCDLCDTASHTYCVGLGATVPEGDWYCTDCALTRAEQTDDKMDDNVENVHVDECATTDPISIFDIVRELREREPREPGTDRLLKLVSSNPMKFSASSIVSDQPSSSLEKNLSISSGILISGSADSKSSVRTLRKCRNVHRHVRVLREHWEDFRTGYLSFSANLSRPSKEFNQNINESAMSVKLQCQLHPTKSSQSKAQETLSTERSYNVQRAWKLMNVAKSLQEPKKTKFVSKSASENTRDMKLDNLVSKGSLFSKKDLMLPKMGVTKSNKKVNENLVQSSGKYQSRSVYKNSEFQSRGKFGTGVSSAFSNNSVCSISSPKASCTNLSRQKIPSFQMKSVGNLNISVGDKYGAQTDFCCDRAGLASCSNPDLSQEFVAEGSTVSSTKLRKEVSEYPRNGGYKLISKIAKNDEAKNEILSLVKLNLKLFCKEKRLESETFKEIARLSTHTILAACGFEHRDIVRSIPTFVCHHDNQTQRLPRSALVPSSCRDCFYTFVKDVIYSIMTEKNNK